MLGKIVSTSGESALGGKSALQQLLYELVFIKPGHMNRYKEIQVYVVCHFLSLAVNTLIFGIYRWNLYVLTR